jgi:hypothetical protein
MFYDNSDSGSGSEEEKYDYGSGSDSQPSRSPSPVPRKKQKQPRTPPEVSQPSKKQKSKAVPVPPKPAKPPKSKSANVPKAPRQKTSNIDEKGNRLASCLTCRKAGRESKQRIVGGQVYQKQASRKNKNGEVTTYMQNRIKGSCASCGKGLDASYPKK